MVGPDAVKSETSGYHKNSFLTGFSIPITTPILNEHNMTDKIEYLYRYDTRFHGSMDEYGDVTFRYSTIQISKFKILKRTPCGAWIDYAYRSKKFVNLTCRKQYACETPEKALQSFICRKKRQVKILSSQLKDAESVLRIAEAATPDQIGKHIDECDSMFSIFPGIHS